VTQITSAFPSDPLENQSNVAELLLRVAQEAYRITEDLSDLQITLVDLVGLTTLSKSANSQLQSIDLITQKQQDFAQFLVALSNLISDDHSVVHHELENALNLSEMRARLLDMDAASLRIEADEEDDGNVMLF
jgi:hypothetical protein